MASPMPPRRRASDHPQRRLQDAPAHKRLLQLVIIAIVIGGVTVFLTLTEFRYRESARAEDLADVRNLTEQLANLEENNGRDMREHRIRNELLFRRLCTLMAEAHPEIDNGDCPDPLTHSADPDEPGAPIVD